MCGDYYNLSPSAQLQFKVELGLKTNRATAAAVTCWPHQLPAETPVGGGRESGAIVRDRS